jgi:adhesin/invasin
MSKKAFTAAVASGIVAVAYSCTIRDITQVPVATVVVEPSSVTLLEGETRQLSAKVKDGVGRELPSGAVTWSSDASTVFSIDGDGSGEARAAGATTVWATLDGVRGSASISVEPGPRLLVDQPQLQFYLGLAGPAPDPISLGITNGGGGSVGGISATVQYPEGGKAGWLSLALTGTVAPSTLRVSVPLGLLGEGVYDATLVVASKDAVNSPVTLPVHAAVTQTQPLIGLSPRTLAFQADAPGGPPAPLTVQVANVGGGVLSDLQAVPLYFGVGGWLTTSLTGITAPAELAVQPDPTGLAPGVYTAEVRVTGPGALNTPQSVGVTFTVEVGPVSPPHSVATVPNGSAGAATGIVVETRDANGNPLREGGETVAVTVSGANNPGALVVNDSADGIYTATYTPTTAGTDEVAITINGTPISGSPFTTTVGPGAVSPANSTASVPAGVVGIPTGIVIQARDAFNNPLRTGGDLVVVTVSGANNPGALTVTDLANGTYTATYTPTIVGIDKVAITLNGRSIGGSPLTTVVAAGAANPAQSTATVPDGTAGLPTTIVVQARDTTGNPVTVGGETVVVTVSGANNPGALTVADQGDGTYTASYTPTVAGVDNVAITMNGTAIGGSPFTSTVGASGVIPAQSTATVPDGTPGLPTEIVVQARDATGNPVSAGGETVAVTVSGANNPGALVVTDQGDGTYTASYAPTVAGDDTVAITMNGTPISGSPFTSTVGAGGASAAQSTATVPDGAPGLPTQIVVQARDAYGNPLSAGGETVTVTVSGANNPGALIVTDQANGTYTASYTPTLAGTDDVAITLNGTPIGGSPFTSTVSVGTVSPAQSTATVPDGIAGALTSIVVQARDAYGNPMSAGGETVAVTVSGTNNAGALTVTDQGDGTYTAGYTPTVAGADNVDITMNGTAISGSPFTSAVAAGAVSPAQSTATVPDGTAGAPTAIVVQARDTYGNPLGSGGATVAVTVSGANNAGALTVTDQANGTYTAGYTPSVLGTDNVAITIDGTPVSGSPFTSTVGVGAVSPANSTATVPNGIAGALTSIVVQARDAYGNPLDTGGEAVGVTVSGANNAGALTVTDQANGTYAASYTPTAVGTDNVAITINGTAIGGSPFASTVGAGAVSPANSTATVPGGSAGSATSIVVRARDAYGNPLSTGGETVSVTVSGTNNAGALTVTDQGNGTYTASYTPTTLGTDNVAITINGTPISGSPFTSSVGPGAVSPANSTATVPDGTAGLSTAIVVQAWDAYGNPLSSGGATVAVTVSGANNAGALSVTDQGNGTYTASYTPTAAGTDNLAITINGTAIGGSPFTSAVGVGAVSPANSTASVPGGTVGVPITIVVQARDAYGNPLDVGGENVVVTVTGKNPTGPITATDEGDGTYTASYTPLEKGNDKVAITMNGTPISGSPFNCKVDIGAVSQGP